MSDDEEVSSINSDPGFQEDSDLEMGAAYDDDDSSIDDTAFDDGDDDPIKEKRKAYQVEFKCLSVEDIEKRQTDDAVATAEMLAIEPQEALILLRHYGWNKDKLIENYMENMEKCKLEAGLETGRQPRLKRVRGFLCQVCYLEDSSVETIALSCNHRYCRDCYTQYLNQKINDGESKRIQCMQSKCPLIVDEKTVELLVDATMSDRYKRLLNRTYVDDNPSLRWCPGPDCTYAVECHVPAKSLDSIVPSVKCDACHYSFCFGCGLSDHQPCICPLVKKWLKKCADDSETANWISANTKECPKCQATIEKNGGCNHMTCKKCRYEFCWVCMGEWSIHGTSWYSCNRYEEKEKGQDAQSKSRASLERYLHYYNRYANHEQSSKLDQDLYLRIEKKMNEIQVASNLSWIEVQFMKRAVDTLSVCRATLKWSYALAFYMVRDNQTELFEQNQSDLEMAVEALSELIEKPIETETIPDLRAQVTNRTVYVGTRNEVMLEDAAKGTAEGRWTFIS